MGGSLQNAVIFFHRVAVARFQGATRTIFVYCGATESFIFSFTIRANFSIVSAL